MTVAQALAYFLREAVSSLRRSWKVGALAVLTIAVSLFLGGTFLLLTGNVERIVEGWRSQAKVILYLEAESPEDARDALRSQLLEVPWVRGVEAISSAGAEARFAETFPDLAGLVAGWEDSPLPASFEISFDPDAVDAERMTSWLASLAAEPVVAMADDDRRWLRQIEAMVVVTRTLGLGFGAVFLTAAIVTIASVIRLTVYLYRDEIAVMRMVGATELVIRGPFVVEGLLQGLLGGIVAVGALFGAYRLMASQPMPTILGTVFLERFLPLEILVGLVALGGAAGLLAAVLSLSLDRD